MPGPEWGDPAHFTLTRPFSPDERCRQLVFWAVDWQSYEDCETAPSAPVDACRYPRGAPRNPSGGPSTFDDLMARPVFFDWQQYIYRNPEKVLAFTEAMDAQPTGLSTIHKIVGADGNGQIPDPANPGQTLTVGIGNSRYDQGSKQVFSGLYGADRNFNLHLDRGPVPRTVRLRASTIARFNFYDLRAPAALR